MILPLSAVLLLAVIATAVPAASNSKDGGHVAELPENWDQTKDDTQSLFLNKSDKNDLEPYPLALSEEGNSEGYEQNVEQRGYEEIPQSAGELENLIMRPALYGEPPAIEGLSRYDTRRRKRGSGTKVGGAGAATKVATKSGSGKKNLKAPSEPNRRKRDSGLSAADVRALLSLWEAQERRKSEWNNNQWAAERYYGRLSPAADDNDDVGESGEIWYNEPIVVGARERDFKPHPSYFSEQNRLALAHYPEMVDPELVAQRYEEARRKRQYLANNKVKRFMVARKRSEAPLMHQNNYRPRDDLYTLAELLRTAPRVNEQDIPVYRRFVL